MLQAVQLKGTFEEMGEQYGRQYASDAIDRGCDHASHALSPSIHPLSHQGGGPIAG